MSGAHVPDVHVAKKIKCENPFPNWKPITKISYIELDIIVSKLVLTNSQHEIKGRRDECCIELDWEEKEHAVNKRCNLCSPKTKRLGGKNWTS